MIEELEHGIEIKGFWISDRDGWLSPPIRGMGGFVSLRHHPCSSFLLKAFTTNRYAIGWAFLILACLQAYSLCSFLSKFRI